MKRILFLLFNLFVCFLLGAQVVNPLIPYPQEIKGNGTVPFKLSPMTGIQNESSTVNNTFLRDVLEQDFLLVLQDRKGVNQIVLKEDKNLEKALGREGYTLTVNPESVVIMGANETGVFYGIQTLRQLVERTTMNIPSVKIVDKPNYEWRAMMLDESRHLKGKRVVKDLLDHMAFLKMNVFHWHLTDDQGWRLEIKRYPKLTEVAAFRDSSEIGGWHTNRFDGKPHGGYYTQEDVREIIAYAAQRHIMVVPEIEMPGHATAVVAAYPEVGVLDHPIKVPCKFGVSSSVFNVADDKTIEFIHNVLEEVFALFPSKVIHIGGDEIHFEEWKASKQINSFMKKKMLKNYNDLQLYFTNQISHFFQNHQRYMMGWNDIMGKNIHEWSDEGNSQSGTLSKDAIVHFWKGDSSLMTDALMNGYKIVNSTHSYTYLDYTYDLIPLSKAYEFSPFPQGVDAKYKSQVLGLGCQLWSEWVITVSDLYRQVYPRLAAYAEVGWTMEHNKNFDRFKKGVEFFRENNYIPKTEFK